MTTSSTNPGLPATLKKILSEDNEPDVVFTALMSALCKVLQCDCCFLYLRHPQTYIGKITHCWVRDAK
jgi:GAF domain-containing protein